MAGMLDTIREAREIMRGDVGAFDLGNEDEFGALAAFAAQGEAGRQGPVRQAEAEENFRQASIEAARSGDFRSPALPDFFGSTRGPADVRPPLAPRPVAEQPLSMEEYLVQATMGFDPLGGAIPNDIDRDELELRRGLLETLLNYRQDQEAAVYERSVAPYRQAAELMSLGVPIDTVESLTGVRPVDPNAEPVLDPNSLEGRMEALQMMEVEAQLAEMENSAAVRGVQAFGLDRALANLGVAQDTVRTGNRSFGFTGLADTIGPDFFPMFGMREGERELGRDELVPEFVQNENFNVLAAEVENMVRAGSPPQVIAEEVREAVAMSEAIGQPLPEQTLAVVMEMMSPLWAAQGVNFGGTFGG